MIAGFGGEMISHAYLEERGLVSIDTIRAGFADEVVRWWRHVSKTLGPASSARAVCDVAVTQEPPWQASDPHSSAILHAVPSGLRCLHVGPGGITSFGLSQ